MPSQPIKLKVTALNKSGVGIGHYEDKKIFVPLALPGEEVLVVCQKIKKDLIEARLIEVIKPSADRAKPGCQYFGVCGGCQLQHLSKQSYEALKRDWFVKATGQEANSFFAGSSRRRATFKLAKGELGFFASYSHELVDIDTCLVLDDKLQALIKPLKALSYGDEVYALSSDTGLDLEFVASKVPEISRQQALVNFATEHKIARIIVRANGQAFPIVTRQNVQMKFGDLNVDLPAGCFVQASQTCQEFITNVILSEAHKAKKIIDLYAGCGAYSLPMAKHSKVHAVEGDGQMMKALARVAKVSTETRDLFLNPVAANELNKYDMAVINPPRNGAQKQIEQLAASKVKMIAMVSCNLESFARDMKILLAAGYKNIQSHIVDQFRYSYHMEIVALFAK